MRSALLPLAACMFCSCAGEGGTAAITESREIDVETERPVKVGASSAERFGSMPDAHARAQENTPELVWRVPEGWTEEPPTQYRRANLRPAGHPEADCFLSVAGGTVVQNLERWCAQMGKPPLTAEEIAALPKQALLDLEALRVDLTGTFAGMGEQAPREGFRFVGLIAAFQDQLLFVKMTGPAEVIGQELERFDQFVASLVLLSPEQAAEWRRSRAAAAKAAAAPDDGTGTGSAPEDGAAAQGAATDRVAGSRHGIRYEAPLGWSLLPGSSVRVVTLRPAGTKETECAVSLLGGDGGGIPGNVDRWRGQLGLPAASAAEHAALPRVKIAGADGVVVDLTGPFEDAMTARKLDHARFLGAIALLPQGALFVKLTGPQSEVDDAVKSGFLELLASLANG